MENICELYKRIMKYDMEVVDEIESLEQAKGVIKMMLENTVFIVDKKLCIQ